jgi:hypothetical protein
MSLLIHTLDQVLEQGVSLLLALDDEHYKTQTKNNSATIGAHYRHCLDHFERLLEGVPKGVIDYDARKRDQDIEIIRDAAMVRTHELRKSARALDTEILPRSIQIRCAFSGDDGGAPDVISTIEREIMFCISHAIHHYALIGMLCRSMEVRLPEEFGVAPSTLKYRQATAKVAA